LLLGAILPRLGLVNQLFKEEPKYLLIDELEEMNAKDQASLLRLIQTEIISEIKVNKTRELNLSS